MPTTSSANTAATLQVQARAMREAVDQAAADTLRRVRKLRAERIAAGKPASRPNPMSRYDRATYAGRAGVGIS